VKSPCREPAETLGPGQAGEGSGGKGRSKDMKQRSFVIISIMSTLLVVSVAFNCRQAFELYAMQKVVDRFVALNKTRDGLIERMNSDWQHVCVMGARDYVWAGHCMEIGSHFLGDLYTREYWEHRSPR